MDNQEGSGCRERRHLQSMVNLRWKEVDSVRIASAG